MLPLMKNIEAEAYTLPCIYPGPEAERCLLFQILHYCEFYLSVTFY